MQQYLSQTFGILRNGTNILSNSIPFRYGRMLKLISNVISNKQITRDISYHYRSNISDEKTFLYNNINRLRLQNQAKEENIRQITINLNRHHNILDQHVWLYRRIASFFTFFLLQRSLYYALAAAIITPNFRLWNNNKKK